MQYDYENNIPRAITDRIFIRIILSRAIAMFNILRSVGFSTWAALYRFKIIRADSRICHVYIRQ